MASDSLATVTKANAIAQGDFDRRRPLSLSPDGDLWELFAEALETRGHDSFAISWTKAHATADNICRGDATERGAIANGYADTAAGAGIETQGYADLQQLFAYYAQK